MPCVRRIGSLTPTERKVFDLVVRGKLNKQIAVELGMTERTVKWHRHNIMPKLQVQSLAGLVSLAEQLGMIGARRSPRPCLRVGRTPGAVAGRHSFDLSARARPTGLC